MRLLKQRKLIEEAWWSQTATVEYERHIGRRAEGQLSSGKSNHYLTVMSHGRMGGCPDEQTAVRRFYADRMYDQTLVRAGSSSDELYAQYEGLPIARGRNRFLPWRDPGSGRR